MAGISRQTFINRIKQSLQDRGAPIDLPDDLEIARVIGGDVDPVATFAANVEAAYMKPYRVSGEQACADKVIALVEELEAKSAVVPDEDFVGRAAIVEKLQEKGIKLVNADDRDEPFDADVGITGVSCAVAETGSISVTSGQGRRRLASLAVPYHIAIVRAGQIVPDLLDWGVQAGGDRPAVETLVSGPSKTADIELNLVIGVHGPGQEHIVIVE